MGGGIKNQHLKCLASFQGIPDYAANSDIDKCKSNTPSLNPPLKKCIKNQHLKCLALF